MSALTLPLFTANTWTASYSRPNGNPPTRALSVQRLLSLLDENGEDDYGQIGPTQHAFKSAILLVVDAVSLLGEDLPSSPAVDSQGGIRITWRQGDGQVKLVCPATSESPVYIYYSSSEANALQDHNVNAAVLAERLTWLTSRASTAAA